MAKHEGSSDTQASSSDAKAQPLRPPFSPHSFPPPSRSTTASQTISRPPSHRPGHPLFDEPNTQTLEQDDSVDAQASSQISDADHSSLQAVLKTLPALYEPLETKHNFLPVRDDIPGFVARDLDLKRLNDIDSMLWMAGRPMRARPLHRYKMLGHEVLVTEQMDLHLLRANNRIFIKPLPEYYLSFEFWESYICTVPQSSQRSAQELWGSAAGFLLSWAWLLVSEYDLWVAKQHHLVPLWMDWNGWKTFVNEFTANVDINTRNQVNKRWAFGDLRLGRVNTVYRLRFFTSHFVRGYLYGYNRYVVFFNRNFSWILIVFVFFSLVLSAQQVGEGLDQFQGSKAFMNVCYGFVIFSMVCVAAVLGVVSILFTAVFLYNMWDALSHDSKERRRKMKIAQEKKNRDV